MSIQPGVTVIVPVWNARSSIGPLIESLLATDYPPECREILIIDNGSTDDTREVVHRFPVTLLVEDGSRSSYAARNLGVKNARHKFLAFTDADCTVTRDWIREGVRTLQETPADLAGGRIRFVTSSPPQAAEVFDAIAHMRNESLIAEGRGAVTANLFVRASVFTACGPFPNEVKSGSDLAWTREAARKGHTLIFAPDAVVLHPARRLCSLLAKASRVGEGSVESSFREKRNGRDLAGRLVTSVVPFPSRVRRIKRLVSERAPDYGGKYLRVFAVSYAYGLFWSFGVARSWLSAVRRSRDTHGGASRVQDGSGERK
jgi:glycosyltransferase involved in cell wall biosynthesis